MKHDKQITSTIIILTIGLLLTVTTNLAYAQPTYYIDESTDFTGNGCTNIDLNTVTSELRDSLDLDSWSGLRYVNPDAWPSDFVEHCSTNYLPSGSTASSGLDSTYADTRSFTVYAGHGNKGVIQFGFQHDNICVLDMFQHMRLGSMDGNESAVAWYLTSCTLNTSVLVSDANWQWTNQQFGFHNSPGIEDSSPAWAYVASGSSLLANNKDAWLWAMDYAEDVFDDGEDSPVAVSYASTSSGCQTVHNSASLRSQTYITDRSGGPSCNQTQPLFYYCYSIVNNGGCP
jgi:hypothetical protein